MATAYTAFYDHVLPHVPGCPQGIATLAIRQAAIEFCRRSGIWYIDHPAIDVVANQASYPYAAGVAGAVVEETLKAWFNGKEIHPATKDDLNRLFANDWRTKTGTPDRFTQYTARSLILVPKPVDNLAAGLVLIVSLKPSAASTGMDDTIFEEYHEGIAAGAKSRLMLSQKKPYSNAQQAEIEKGYFEHCIAEAHERVDRSFGRALRRMKSNFF
jgi:hypothetical protein